VSLRAFHLLFIAMSVVLAAFVAAWAAQQYQTLHAPTYALAALVSLVMGAGLAFYGAAFQKKTRRLR
jgi:predicted Na+-dependent transporter